MHIMLVYVIGWGAVVFGINCASNVGKNCNSARRSRALLQFSACIMSAINPNTTATHTVTN